MSSMDEQIHAELAVIKQMIANLGRHVDGQLQMFRADLAAFEAARSVSDEALKKRPMTSKPSWPPSKYGWPG